MGDTSPAAPVVAGYRIQDEIGRGGMGIVYRAEHVHLRRTVALKVLTPELAADPGFRERFLQESQIAAALHHPSIVTVHDAGEADGQLYIAMHYVDGIDLASVLRESGALEPKRALTILRQVADAIDAAHAHGVVHRDVKPANILLDGDRAYLTDFGLTKSMSSKSGLTVKGDFVGTIDYVAPEQIEGSDIDGRTDVYALGCVLVHALTGTVPFDRDSDVSRIYAHMQESPPPVAAREQSLPPALDGVIARALAKRKEERFETATKLIEAAAAAFGEEPAASAPSPVSRPAPSAARLKILVADPLAGIRALARIGLPSDRLEVFETETAEEAVALARRERPDLALVAWSLGAGELGRKLKDAGAAKVVAMATRSERVDEDMATEAGFEGLLRKPFSSMQVLHAVSDHVKLQSPPATSGRATPEPVRRTEAPVIAPPQTPSSIHRLVQRSLRRATILGGGAVGLVIVLGALFALGVLPPGGSSGNAVQSVVRAAAPSTVQLEARRGNIPIESGSGWVLDAPAGLVVTNAHVVNAGSTFFVGGHGSPRPAQVVGVAPCEDVAVLKVQDTSSLKTLQLGNQSSVRAGETVVAVGYPANASEHATLTSTTGVVSVPRTSYRETTSDIPFYTDVIQTDAAVNPGNSGGPLLDLQGRMIGMNSAARTIAPDGRIIEGQSYAIGIDRLRRIAGVLRSGRSLGWLGLGFEYRADGLRVAAVVPGSPADGVVPPGSVLQAVDGLPVTGSLQSYCDAIQGVGNGAIMLRVVPPEESIPRLVRVRST